jgi:hypothetical protein
MTAVLLVCPWFHDSMLLVCPWFHDSSAFGLSMVYSVILSVAQTIKNQMLEQCVNNEVEKMQEKVDMV